jgi:GMP synthase (glutamine-hydrolysing)
MRIGVMGDAGSYDFVLRASRGDLDQRHDRRPFSFAHEFLGRAAPRIINEARHQPRRLRQTSKSPGMIEGE